MNRTKVLGKRFYELEEGGRQLAFPSVTTIISETSDKTWLYEWRKRVGEKKANSVSKKSAGRGSIMHFLLEVYTKTHGNKKDRLNQTFEIASKYDIIKNTSKEYLDLGRSLFYNIYNAGFLDDIKETHLNEEYLYHIVKDFKTIPIGYSGAVDNTHWTFSNMYKVVDFKTSLKPKKESQIQNYKEQTSAYSIAVAKRFGIIPDCAEIWISNEESSIPQKFVLDQKDIIHHYKIFTNRVYRFYKTYKYEIADHYKNNLNK